MRKIILSVVLLIPTVLSVCARSIDNHGDCIRQMAPSEVVIGMPANKVNTRQIEPTYVDGAYQSIGGGQSNWFLEVMGGTSAFVGTPVGCGDLFDRTNFVLNAAIGKWFNPYIGLRFDFEGFKFKDLNLNDCKFQNYHMDFMYNVSSHLRKDVETLAKWDFIPYVGLGLINNVETEQHPFTFSYGFKGRYRLSDRLHLVGEVGGTTTFQDFDGFGSKDEFGDNLFHCSLGLSITFGNVGWKKVVDAKPYMLQNAELISSIKELNEQNDLLRKKNSYKDNAVKELYKILEIEGLCEKYCVSEPYEENKLYPKNNYSGIISLRARMKHQGCYDIVIKDSMSTQEYMNQLAEGKENVGSPILLFFKFNSTSLTDDSQKVNVAEIAKVVNKFNLRAVVIGAADSKTGSSDYNMKLSKKRAEKISTLLKSYGVADSNIQIQFKGGINEYKPVKANRNTCVLLYLR